MSCRHRLRRGSWYKCRHCVKMKFDSNTQRALSYHLQTYSAPIALQLKRMCMHWNCSRHPRLQRYWIILLMLTKIERMKFLWDHNNGDILQWLCWCSSPFWMESFENIWWSKFQALVGRFPCVFQSKPLQKLKNISIKQLLYKLNWILSADYYCDYQINFLNCDSNRHKVLDIIFISSIYWDPMDIDN